MSWVSSILSCKIMHCSWNHAIRSLFRDVILRSWFSFSLFPTMAVNDNSLLTPLTLPTSPSQTCSMDTTGVLSSMDSLRKCKDNLALQIDCGENQFACIRLSRMQACVSVCIISMVRLLLWNMTFHAQKIAWSMHLVGYRTNEWLFKWKSQECLSLPTIDGFGFSNSDSCWD